jgi:phosphopantetheinyl transferase
MSVADLQAVRGELDSSQPVFADALPSVEHVEELQRRLHKNTQEREAYLAELAELQRVCSRVADKCQKLIKRYGGEA